MLRSGDVSNIIQTILLALCFLVTLILMTMMVSISRPVLTADADADLINKSRQQERQRGQSPELEHRPTP